MSRNTLHLRSNRGSVLMVALIFAAIIGISLGSYVTLSNNSQKQSQRSFYSISAVNLTEIGLESALAAFNELDNTTAANAWTGWTLDNTPYDSSTSPFTPSARRTFDGFNVGPNTTATVKVWAQHYEGATTTATPKIVAKATIAIPNSPPIEKIVEVVLRKRSVLGYGVSAIDDVRVVGGNFQGKSYDSDPEEDGTYVAYAEANNTANLTIGSVQGNINLGGGNVWGYTKVSNDTHSDVGGSVHGLGTTVNDPTRRTDDFNATFPMKTSPSYAYTVYNSNITTSKTFPINVSDTNITIPAGMPNAGEQMYVYKFSAGTQISLNGSDRILISPGKNVMFIMESHSGVTAIKTSGGAVLEIGADASLNIYTNGNCDITGGGILNNNLDAKSFFLWGTNASSVQDIKVAGNGQFTGVLYAPNANLDIKGGGTDGKVTGAVVGKSVNFNGTTNFYYDEELAELTIGNPYGAAKWKELQTASERAVYATPLNF